MPRDSLAFERIMEGMNGALAIAQRGEIGDGESPNRRRATRRSTPIHLAPSAPTEASEPRRKWATAVTTPKDGAPASDPIAPPATAVRRRRARGPATPTRPTPSVATFGEGATYAAIPTVEPPLSPNPIGSEQSAAGGEGHNTSDTHVRHALAAIVSELASKQRQRRFCIVTQSMLDRRIESLIASHMGFRIDASEKDRKALFARAKAHRVAVEKSGEGQSTTDAQAAAALSALTPLIRISAANRQPWDELRNEVEKTMRRLAKELPCYAFAEQVRGFGDLALAVLQAEAGIPFAEYRTVSGLWKRLGLAVINGERQRRKTGKEAAAEHGYSPSRRAEVFAFISDSMFRGQWRAADEDTGEAAGPRGPYGEVYARRRAHTEPRIEATEDLPAADSAKWTKGRCHNDARRVMSKALLRDLWRVSKGLPPITSARTSAFAP